ncbi:MAG: chloride channel protein [Lachnospiraceae bacterium]|uniref:Chloride channel protein n=1 Tax=Candidatus Weimeria bifida TaxID=2599074 RepID=A0A6N7IXT5_9FIRM|nr:chloride channel protein [Candidatus Weimeria bifida]RRF95113.1 MAG: chloride channel protein [Lachnospiraceae bacterium]
MKKIIEVTRIILISILIGVILGIAGALFYLCISGATAIRQAHPQFLILLPVGAVLVTLLYQLFKNEDDGGTNRVLESAYSNAPVSLKMAPSIFLSTVFSHLCGASVGREGAALQLGGSLGYNTARLFHLSDREKSFCTCIGMSACFSSLFGTPMAAAIFSIEIAVVGRLNVLCLVPSVIASYISRLIARSVGAPDMKMKMDKATTADPVTLLKVTVIAVSCGLVAMLFCRLLSDGVKLTSLKLKNKYLRALILGSAVFALSLIFPGQTYNGAGVDQIAGFMKGDVLPWQFALKMLFTLISVYAGYKGGEIVPAFYIGASLGAFLGHLLGLPPALACSVGMVSLFCGVTNCPLTAFAIGIEIFGTGTAPFFLLASAFSFFFSGKAGLYSSQKRQVYRAVSD